MSVPVTLTAQESLPPRRRALPLLAVGLARLLAPLRPWRLPALLGFLRRGAAPATTDDVRAALLEVVGVSPHRAGRACLQRSVATALLCRARGVWPTWCSGVRTDPFAAHSWIEVDGQPVGEPDPAGRYLSLLSIPPS